MTWGKVLFTLAAALLVIGLVIYWFPLAAAGDIHSIFKLIGVFVVIPLWYVVSLRWFWG